MIMNLGNKRERRAGEDSTGLQQCPQTSHKGCVTAPDTNFPLTYLLLWASGKLVKWSPLTLLYWGGNQGLEILRTPPKPVQLSRKQDVQEWARHSLAAGLVVSQNCAHPASLCCWDACLWWWWKSFHFLLWCSLIGFIGLLSLISLDIIYHIIYKL